MERLRWMGAAFVVLIVLAGSMPVARSCPQGSSSIHHALPIPQRAKQCLCSVLVAPCVINPVLAWVNNLKGNGNNPKKPGICITSGSAAEYDRDSGSLVLPYAALGLKQDGTWMAPADKAKSKALLKSILAHEHVHSTQTWPASPRPKAPGYNGPHWPAAAGGDYAAFVKCRKVCKALTEFAKACDVIDRLAKEPPAFKAQKSEAKRQHDDEPTYPLPFVNEKIKAAIEAYLTQMCDAKDKAQKAAEIVNGDGTPANPGCMSTATQKQKDCISSWATAEKMPKPSELAAKLSKKCEKIAAYKDFMKKCNITPPAGW